MPEKEPKIYQETMEKGPIKVTEEKVILPQEQQKELARYFGLKIEGLSQEKIQEKIDEEIAKEFGLRTFAVVNLGKENKQKFILVKNQIEKNEVWYLLTGPVEYHKELAEPFQKLEGKKEIRGGGIIKIDREKNEATIYGTSYAFGDYSKEEIELFKEALKANLEVEKVKIEPPGSY
jgi:hypothetical protein